MEIDTYGTNRIIFGQDTITYDEFIATIATLNHKKELIYLLAQNDAPHLQKLVAKTGKSKRVFASNNSVYGFENLKKYLKKGLEDVNKIANRKKRRTMDQLIMGVLQEDIDKMIDETKNVPKNKPSSNYPPSNTPNPLPNPPNNTKPDGPKSNGPIPFGPRIDGIPDCKAFINRYSKYRNYV